MMNNQASPAERPNPDFDPFDDGLGRSDHDLPGLLREAWATSSGPSATDRLLRRSLTASAQRVAELGPTIRALQADGRSQLDLHLEGGEEAKHETSANSLGDFLKRVSKATRDVAKSVAGISQLRGDIRVLAPSPGSVRVVFLEGKKSPHEDGRPDFWATGMERVASTFELASSDSELLDASLLDLTLNARLSLRLLAQTVSENEWAVQGELTTRDGEQSQIHFNTSAALRLVAAADRRPSSSFPIQMGGKADGWRWSSSTLRIKPDRGAALEVFVPDALREDVAQWNAEHRLLQASVEVTEFLAPQTANSRIRRTYKLLKAEPSETIF